MRFYIFIAVCLLHFSSLSGQNLNKKPSVHTSNYEELKSHFQGKDCNVMSSGEGESGRSYLIPKIAEIHGDYADIMVRTFLLPHDYLHPNPETEPQDRGSSYFRAKWFKVFTPFLGVYHSYIFIDGKLKYLVLIGVHNDKAEINLFGNCK